jgi:hypothetical protein
MTFTITVPSSKIILLQTLVKKTEKRFFGYRYVLFTPLGLCIDMKNSAHLFVPVELDLSGIKEMFGQEAFSMPFKDGFDRLTCTGGDVTFTFTYPTDKKTEKSEEINESDESDESNESNESNESEQEYPKLKHCPSITYYEKGIVRRLSQSVDIESVSLNDFAVPADTIESSRFLSAVATCVPYCGDGIVSDSDGGGYYDAGMLCVERDIMGASDQGRIAIAKNLDIASLFSDGASDCFWLSRSVFPLLPKSGTCRLALETKTKNVSEYGNDEKRKVFCLYIGFPDYCIFISDCFDTTSQYPKLRKWMDGLRKRLTENPENTNRLHIDDRDRLACIQRLDVLPKDKNATSNTIHVHIVEGRLCIDSCSVEISNARLRFSEFTIGDLTPMFMNNSYLGKALQSPVTGVRQIDGDCLLIESDDAVAAIMGVIRGTELKEKEIISVVDLQDHWKPEQPVKKPVAKKQLGSLFVNTYRDIIETLQKENEQLKKENEQLRQELMV